MSTRNKRKKRSAEIQLDAQRKCFEHVIRAVGDFKGMDENVGRMQAEIWQRELECIAKKKENRFHCGHKDDDISSITIAVCKQKTYSYEHIPKQFL